MLQDCLDHAQGLILGPDFDEWYRLTRDGRRDRISRDYLGKTIRVNAPPDGRGGPGLAGEASDASVAEFLEHFRAQGEDSLHMEAPGTGPDAG
ncbi:hypothetical protein ACFU53_09000 [Streptomyces sp. NPDC057474]|uniref:hypothetical protein n=1 Tax=Streptomyces sp. NPDC057474 TaxID=3346144 RepID=UPI0036C3D8C3